MDERAARFLVQPDKVLKLLIDEKCKGNTNGEGELSGREIVEALGMTQEHYLQRAQYLLEADLAQGDGMGALDGGIWVTSKGIEFYEQQRAVYTVQIGAVFQGPVHGAPIQAVANAGHSSVQQIVDGELLASAQEIPLDLPRHRGLSLHAHDSEVIPARKQRAGGL